MSEKFMKSTDVDQLKTRKKFKKDACFEEEK